MKINGNLKFHTLGDGELQNAVMERAADITSLAATVAGRIAYQEGATLGGAGYYYADGTNWIKFATGGSATALQHELDAIEVSIGGLVKADGTFDNTVVITNVTSPTSVTDILQQLGNAIAGKDALSELTDVDTGAANANAANKDVLMWNSTSSKWEDHALVLADVSDVTATVAQVNGFDGRITASAGDISDILTFIGAVDADTTPTYSSGTNIVQGSSLETAIGALDAALDGLDTNKQPIDAGLTALAAAGTGIVSMDGDAVTFRTITAPAAGISIANGNGVSGNPTLSLANDLAALEGLTTVGYIVRTADGTAATRTMSVTTTDLAITGAADGVTTDTTFSLAEVTQAATGDFVKVTLDSKGRVTGNTAVVASDITALVDATYVDVAGDTMTGNLTMTLDTYIDNPTPTAGFTLANQLVNKNYVDNLITGISWKEPVGSVSATAPATAAVGDRYINTTDGKVYTATAVNTWGAGVSPGANWTVLDKATDAAYTYDDATSSWIQFSGAGQIVNGTGLTKAGNTLSVNMGAGIVNLPSNEVGIDLYNTSTGALILTTDGSASSTDTAAKLFLKLDSAGALVQTVDGLKIDAGKVTVAMLAESQFTINADTGTDALVLGDTFEIRGTSTQGISTSVTESPAGTSTFTITAGDASASQKGVATFNTASFTTTAGDVTIKSAGITNAMLVNDFVTVSDGTANDGVALGETLTFTGTAPIKTAVTANTVTISADAATTTALGIAKFDAGNFTVTAGAVTLNATLDDLANVSTADSAQPGALLTMHPTSGNWVPVTSADVMATVNLDDLGDVVETTTAAGEVLVNNGTNWVNQKIYHKETVGTAATTWTVTHNLGQKYVVVTIVDAADEVIIPQSITFTSATVTTVTFNTAVAGTAIVMGIA
jgi:hypothetical protein